MFVPSGEKSGPLTAGSGPGEKVYRVSHQRRTG